MTQLNMALNKPQTAKDVVDDILDRYPKLAGYRRCDWRNEKAWSWMRRAKPFLRDKAGHTYLVYEGGWTHCLTDPDARTVHVSKLLDPGKKSER